MVTSEKRKSFLIALKNTNLGATNFIQTVANKFCVANERAIETIGLDKRDQVVQTLFKDGICKARILYEEIEVGGCMVFTCFVHDTSSMETDHPPEVSSDATTYVRLFPHETTTETVKHTLNACFGSGYRKPFQLFCYKKSWRMLSVIIK